MKGLRAYLKRDGLLLLGSLLLGVLVWKYVDDELTEGRKVVVRLNMVVPEGLTVISGAVSGVEVTLRGPRGRMAGLDPSRVEARYRIPMPEEPRGSVLVRLSEEDFTGLPQGVAVAVLPEGFTVTVEKQVEKLVDVRVNVNRPPEGFEITRAYALPSKVKVRGTREDIEPMTHVLTEAIDVSGERRNVERKADLEVGPRVHCSERVLVVVEIGRPPVPRDVHNVEVMILAPQNFGRRVDLEEAAITVRVLCDPQMVGVVDPRSIRAMVDVSGLAELKDDTYELPVLLQLPRSLSLPQGAKTPRVRVRLR
ncbi:MAG: CdaR family protein [Planctomycetota bacterium]